MTTTTPKPLPPGRIALPRPDHDPAHGRLVTEVLAGAKASAAWLPQGLDPRLDRLHEAHHERLRQVVGAQADLSALLRAYAQEDADREADLERAAIDRTEAPEDTRTSPAERHRAVDDGSARVWAAVAALGAEVERILFELSELEPDLIDGLRSTAEDADRRYREAVAAARAAHVEAVRAERAAGWIFRTVDGVGGALLASQPAPDLGSIDPSRSPRNPKAFERAWWDAPNRRADAQELHA